MTLSPQSHHKPLPCLNFEKSLLPDTDRFPNKDTGALEDEGMFVMFFVEMIVRQVIAEEHPAQSYALQSEMSALTPTKKP